MIELVPLIINFSNAKSYRDFVVLFHFSSKSKQLNWKSRAFLVKLQFQRITKQPVQFLSTIIIC